MKRKVTAKAKGTYATIAIEACIDSNGRLAREEVEEMRDELADRLMAVASDIKYARIPRYKVEIS